MDGTRANQVRAMFANIRTSIQETRAKRSAAMADATAQHCGGHTRTQISVTMGIRDLGMAAMKSAWWK